MLVRQLFTRQGRKIIRLTIVGTTYPHTHLHTYNGSLEVRLPGKANKGENFIEVKSIIVEKPRTLTPSRLEANSIGQILV